LKPCSHYTFVENGNKREVDQQEQNVRYNIFEKKNYLLQDYDYGKTISICNEEICVQTLLQLSFRYNLTYKLPERFFFILLLLSFTV
jgi:hypothetical protein